MSEHFHYIEDLLNEKTVEVLRQDSAVSGKTARSGSTPQTVSKPREIEIGIVNRKPLYIVFRLDKLKLWGVSDE